MSFRLILALGLIGSAPAIAQPSPSGSIVSPADERGAPKRVGDTDSLQIIHPAQDPRDAPPENFTGAVKVTSPFQGGGGARVRGATVTFQPGARTHWHSHALGQLLIVTDGEGRIQVDGGPVRVIRAGDTIWTAPGVSHWHGAAPDRRMSHVAISEVAPGKSATWGKPVGDDVYRQVPQPPSQGDGRR